MESPLALVLDEDRSVRERVRDALAGEGIHAVAVATPREALETLRAHPFAVVVTIAGDALAPARRAPLEALLRLRAEEARGADRKRILGRSQASEELRRRVEDLAATSVPVLFSGEAGSGRLHAARCLHTLSNASDPFVIVDLTDRAIGEGPLAEGRGTAFVGSLEQLDWSAQEALAAALGSKMIRPRVVASTAIDPKVGAEEGRLLPALVARFEGSIVSVPPLRERASDVAVFVRAFIEELRALNRLPPMAAAPEALAALERYGWPGNVRQLRSAVESAVMVATEGAVRVKDLPEYVLRAEGIAVHDARADRRFRDAKRTVVEAFERSYLEDLLKRHRGNVTGAAEQSGMLRSALQRLLRKHELHSADFRLKAPGRDIS